MSGDLISRQAVLDGIDTYINKAQSTGTQDDFYSFAELVVKALPSINPQEPKADVLDKIRAEIEKPLHDERCFDTADAKAQYIALNWCVEIIDKYRVESEG